MAITKDDIKELHPDGYSRRMIDVPRLREELMMFDKYLMHCENQAKALNKLDRILEVGHIRTLFKETFGELIKDE